MQTRRVKQTVKDMEAGTSSGDHGHGLLRATRRSMQCSCGYNCSFFIVVEWPIQDHTWSYTCELVSFLRKVFFACGKSEYVAALRFVETDAIGAFSLL